MRQATKFSNLQFNKLRLRKIRPIFLTIISLLFLISLIYILKIFFVSRYYDFWFYYNSLQIFIQGGNPYNSIAFPFTYPPLGLIFCLPFAVLPLILAEKAFIVFSFLCLFLSIGILFRFFKIPICSWLSIFLTILVLNFFPVKFTLVMGQINTFILLLLTFFIYYYRGNKQYLSGIALAIALSLKIFPVLLIPYLVISKRWKILISMLLALIIISGAVYLIIPSNITGTFLTKTLPSIFQTGGGTYYFDQSLSSFVARTLHNPISVQLARIISGVILIGTYAILWLYRRFENNQLLGISSILILNIVLNGFAWQHHFIWLIIPLFVTLFYIKSKSLNHWFYLILGLSYLLMALNLKTPTIFPDYIQSHVFYGAILLYGLIMYLIVFKINKPIKINNKNKIS